MSDILRYDVQSHTPVVETIPSILRCLRAFRCCFRVTSFPVGHPCNGFALLGSALRYQVKQSAELLVSSISFTMNESFGSYLKDINIVAFFLGTIFLLGNII